MVGGAASEASRFLVVRRRKDRGGVSGAWLSVDKVEVADEEEVADEVEVAAEVDEVKAGGRRSEASGRTKRRREFAAETPTRERDAGARARGSEARKAGNRSAAAAAEAGHRWPRRARLLARSASQVSLRRLSVW